MPKKELTVILPCAGKGKRLGLSTPKELYEIIPGTRLIDFSLKHIQAINKLKNLSLKVSIVIQPWKRQITKYVIQQLPGIEVKSVLFDDNYKEWPGSVFSANSTFSENNLVLLPDSYLGMSETYKKKDVAIKNDNGRTLIEWVLNALSQYSVIFGCIACNNWRCLQNLGAVRIDNDIITLFQDKPSINNEAFPFNAFWGCFAFKKEVGRSLYEFLINSVLHQSLPLKKQPFYPIGVIPIKEYYDLGTWENIEKFKSFF